MKISVVTPVFNEAGNITKLHAELTSVLPSITKEYEIVAVNDGSTDDSFSILKKIAADDTHLKVIDLQVNSGQTAALLAGLDASSGDVVITTDSDLENDPKDILLLLEKLDDGYDVVSGWRKNRWEGSYLSRKFPSVCANWIISKITGVKLHDYGCTLKVYKKNVIKGVSLYGEMHRFIPAYASWRGARVTEVPVTYRKRTYGKSNYGFSRIFKVLLDLVVIRFLDKYMDKPMHFFGGIGFISLLIGVFAGFLSVVLKLFSIRSFVATPLPVFSALFIIVGVQLIAMGILAEVIMRVYYGSQEKKPYEIKEKLNLS